MAKRRKMRKYNQGGRIENTPMPIKFDDRCPPGWAWVEETHTCDVDELSLDDLSIMIKQLATTGYSSH